MFQGSLYKFSFFFSRKKQGKKPTEFLRGNSSHSDAVKAPKYAKRQLKLNDSSEGFNEEVKLPQGMESIAVFGIDLPSEDAGSVLQFLEFCSKFGKVSSMYLVFFSLTLEMFTSYWLFSNAYEFLNRLLV